MTLTDILQSAQGGQALDNLAARFGLSDSEVKAAAQALVPAFSAALQNLSTRPGGLGGLLTEMANGAHSASYADPGQPAGSLSPEAVGHVFGSSDAANKVVQDVAQASGVSQEVIEGMLPVAGSMLVGGLAHAMAGEGHSGALGALVAATAAPGGLQPATGSGGGFFGSIMGSLFGGAHEPGNTQTAAAVAGLTALSAMFVSGVQASQAQQASLGAVAQSLTQPPPTA